MFGIPLSYNDDTDLATYLFCDNAGLVNNMKLVEYSLNKKNFAIAYHFVRRNVAVVMLVDIILAYSLLN